MFTTVSFPYHANLSIYLHVQGRRSLNYVTCSFDVLYDGNYNDQLVMTVTIICQRKIS